MSRVFKKLYLYNEINFKQYEVTHFYFNLNFKTLIEIIFYEYKFQCLRSLDETRLTLKITINDFEIESCRHRFRKL